MPIRINLLAEAQALEEQRRKDPVKRAVLGAVTVVILTLIYSSTLQVQLMTAKVSLGRMEGRWKTMEKAHSTASECRRMANEAEKKLASLDRLTKSRFLWGNTLNALQQTLGGVDEVQFVRFKTDQSYTIVEEAKPKLPPKLEAKLAEIAEADGKGENKPRIRGKMKEAAAPKSMISTEKISMTIEAMDSSRTPGSQVSKYKENLSQHAYFKDSLQKTNGVLLTSLSPPQVGAGRNSFVTFTVQCLFPEKVRRND
jgi:hypothetical protein